MQSENLPAHIKNLPMNEWEKLFSLIPETEQLKKY
jgi:hypothetical protein